MDKIELKQVDRVVLISDLHYGVKSGGDNTINYLKWMDTDDAYIRDVLIPLIEELKTEGHTPAVIVCGDFFDNRISVRVDVMNRARDIIAELANHANVLFLVGNHDSYHSEDSSVNSLIVVSGIDGVTVIDKDTTCVAGGLNIDMFPWSSDKKALSKKVTDSRADVVLLHADINGLSYPSNTKITTGLDLGGFKGRHVYSGHIHKRQETSKVTYIGSPYELDKSDSGNLKGVYVIGINAETGSYEETFYENLVSPRFFTYTYDEFAKIAMLTPEEFENNYIEITYGKEHRTDIDKVMNETTKYKCASMTFRYIDTDVPTVEVTDVSKTVSITDSITECIDSLTVTDEQRAFLVRKNNEIIDICRNAVK